MLKAVAQGDMHKSISATLDVEGLWSDVKQDPGGKTMFGITKAVFRRAVARNIISANPRGVRGLTVQEAKTIYRSRYWAPIKGDFLPTGLNALVFDIQVNSGQGGRRLQRALNSVYRGQYKSLAADNKIGVVTLARVKAAIKKDPENLYRIMAEVSSRRLLHWTSLRIWRTFKRGWARRGARILIHSVRMAEGKVS